MFPQSSSSSNRSPRTATSESYSIIALMSILVASVQIVHASLVAFRSISQAATIPLHS